MIKKLQLLRHFKIFLFCFFSMSLFTGEILFTSLFKKIIIKNLQFQKKKIYYMNLYIKPKWHLRSAFTNSRLFEGSVQLKCLNPPGGPQMLLFVGASYKLTGDGQCFPIVTREHCPEAGVHTERKALSANNFSG